MRQPETIQPFCTRGLTRRILSYSLSKQTHQLRQTTVFMRVTPNFLVLWLRNGASSCNEQPTSTHFFTQPATSNQQLAAPGAEDARGKIVRCRRRRRRHRSLAATACKKFHENLLIKCISQSFCGSPGTYYILRINVSASLQRFSLVCGLACGWIS